MNIISNLSNATVSKKKKKKKALSMGYIWPNIGLKQPSIF